MTRKIRLTFNKLLDIDEDIRIFRDKSIGKGAYGEVFRCIVKKNKRIKVDREGAIKIFQSQNLIQSKAQQNFHNELACQEALNHPAILEFIGYTVPMGPDSGSFSVVTPFMQNGSLHNILELERTGNSKDGWNNTKRLINVLGIACGMAFVHQNNVIHRDLKTDNVLLDDNYYPKVCDFGLSKAFDETNASKVSMTVNLGTPIYMAPELINGENYGNKVDVFAYSMVLYELFTFELPWYNKPDQYRFVDYINNGLRPDVDQRIPDFFQQVIGACWETSPDKRPTFGDIVANYKKNIEIFETVLPDINMDEVEEYFDEASKGLTLPEI